MRKVYSLGREEKWNWRRRPCYIQRNIPLPFPLSQGKASLFIISSLYSHSPLSACDRRKSTDWVPFPFRTEESSADRILFIIHFTLSHSPVGKKCTSRSSCFQSSLRSMQGSSWWWTRPPSHIRSSCQSEWTGWRSDSHTWRKSRWGRRRRDRWRIGDWGIGRGWWTWWSCSWRVEHHRQSPQERGRGNQNRRHGRSGRKWIEWNAPEWRRLFFMLIHNSHSQQSGCEHYRTS